MTRLLVSEFNSVTHNMGMNLEPSARVVFLVEKKNTSDNSLDEDALEYEELEFDGVVAGAYIDSCRCETCMALKEHKLNNIDYTVFFRRPEE